MKIGHVFINGLIGTAYKEDGTVEKKGVELLDIVEQLGDLDGDEDKINFHINSEGGFVNVGNEIANLIADIPNACTIAEGLCASIATKIHLAADLQNRFIEEGCQYMIHNPFLTNASGDATKLKELSESIQQTENELEKMYSKATGLDKKVVSGLMAQETFLTPDQCVKLKFASQVLPKQEARAVALFYNEKEKEMKTNLTARATAAMAVLTGKAQVKNQGINPLNNAEREVKALMVTTDGGSLETPFSDVMVGDDVMIDGQPAADGSYEITEGEIMLMDGSMAGAGTVIEVADGVISAITPAEVDAENKAAAAGEETVESLKAALEAEKAKTAELEENLTNSNNEKEVIVKQMESAAALGSKWVAPAAENRFRDPNPAAPKAEGITKEGLASRRAEYKKK